MRQGRKLFAVGSVALLLGSLSMAVSSAGTAAASPNFQPVAATKSYAAPKAPTSRLAKTDPRVLTDSRGNRISVMVKLDYDALATYAGGVHGYAATSPSVTGRQLDDNGAPEKSYNRYVDRVENSFVAAAKASVPGAQVTDTLRTVYGGVVMTVPANQARKLVGLPNVVAVQMDEARTIDTDNSPQFIGAPTAWNALGGQDTAGQGIIFASLDTGVWPEHPSFADTGEPPPPPLKNGNARACDFGNNPLTQGKDKFVCNNKLIGGHNFLKTYRQFNPDFEPFDKTARDSDGHGTHTSSTAVGNHLQHAVIQGGDHGPISGLAPGAYLDVFKVCGKDPDNPGSSTCFSSDSAMAVERAIKDGANAINFSIGGGSNPFTDPVELAFLDAYAAGVFVAAAAGNSGPAAGTAEHLSPWDTTAAASTQNRTFKATLTLTGGTDTLTIDGVTITAGISTPTPVVLSSAAPYNDPLCLNPAPAGTFTGKIVACKRGTNARVEKGFNVLQGGAAGMILYNATGTAQDLEADVHWLPAIHVGNGDNLEAFVNGHPGVTATFTTGTPSPAQGDKMADFSSRGPAGLILKPDIAAPGVEVLAGNTPDPNGPEHGAPGNYFQVIAGTSMATPHIAGSAILMKALHPSWTPGQIKSALMTSAVTDMTKEDGVTAADPFDRGAGRVNLNLAGSVGLTIADTADDFALMGNDPLHAIDMNLPSIDAPVMPGRVTTTRTAVNVTNVTQVFTVSVIKPKGGNIVVAPKRLTVAPGSTAKLTITLSSNAKPGTQLFGQVNLAPTSGPALHLPVAFNVGQGAVSLTQACNPSTVAAGGSSTCTVTAQNLSRQPANVGLETTTPKALTITGVNGATLLDPHTVTAAGTLNGKAFGVPAITEGSSFPYVDLSQFVPPESLPDSDEAIINFSVPPFQYAGDTYDTIGITTDGYAVVGGGDATDVMCCPPQSLPNPARPNNVLAPLWSDLNAANAPGIFVALDNEGPGAQWLVFNWQENLFGTTDMQQTEMWVGLNGVEDIAFTYPTDALPHGFPDGTDNGTTIGAENGDGSGGAQVANDIVTGNYTVASSPGTPGGVLSYDVTVQVTKSASVTSEMDADTVSGTTVVKTPIKVR